MMVSWFKPVNDVVVFGEPYGVVFRTPAGCVRTIYACEHTAGAVISGAVVLL